MVFDSCKLKKPFSRVLVYFIKVAVRLKFGGMMDNQVINSYIFLSN